MNNNILSTTKITEIKIIINYGKLFNYYFETTELNIYIRLLENMVYSKLNKE
jgi:hypothetical protein